MSLLNKSRYVRPQHRQESESVLAVLEKEEDNLIKAILKIEEAKSRETGLRERLNIVQQSLQAFRKLEAAPEPIQEVEDKPQLPVTQERRVRKAVTKNSGKPNQRKIESEDIVSDTKNINLVHDDFSTFPE